MLVETETEETIGFFVAFLSLVTFQFGGPEPLGPLPGYAYGRGKCFLQQIFFWVSLLTKFCREVETRCCR